jgi:hypothetical protein
MKTSAASLLRRVVDRVKHEGASYVGRISFKKSLRYSFSELRNEMLAWMRKLHIKSVAELVINLTR